MTEYTVKLHVEGTWTETVDAVDEDAAKELVRDRLNAMLSADAIQWEQLAFPMESVTYDIVTDD